MKNRYVHWKLALPQSGKCCVHWGSIFQGNGMSTIVDVCHSRQHCYQWNSGKGENMAPLHTAFNKLHAIEQVLLSKETRVLHI